MTLRTRVVSMPPRPVQVCGVFYRCPNVEPGVQRRAGNRRAGAALPQNSERDAPGFLLLSGRRGVGRVPTQRQLSQVVITLASVVSSQLHCLQLLQRAGRLDRASSLGTASRDPVAASDSAVWPCLRRQL